MRRSFALACVVLVGLAIGGYGQRIPTTDECEATFDSIGEDSLTKTLTPCAIGGGPTCCSALSGTLGVASRAPLAGCLCNQEVLDGVVEILEGNTLAKAVGFGKERLGELLRECNADFVGNGACNQAPPPPPQPQSQPQPQPQPQTAATQIPSTVSAQEVMRKPPSLKPQPQPRPQVVRPSGDQVIRGEDGQVYVVVQDGTALPGGPQPRGSRTGPGPQIGQIIKGQDGRLYEVVHVIPGHGGSPVSTGGLFGSGSFPIIGTIRDTIQGAAGTLRGMIG